MSIQEIRDLGLLEIYTLGECTSDELKQVEDALIKYPELHTDIKEIGKALELYAYLQRVVPSPTFNKRAWNYAIRLAQN